MRPAQRPHRHRDRAHGYAAMCDHFHPRLKPLPRSLRGRGAAPSWGWLEGTRQGVLDYIDGALGWLADHKEGRRLPDALQHQKTSPQSPSKNTALGEST